MMRQGGNVAVESVATLPWNTQRTDFRSSIASSYCFPLCSASPLRDQAADVEAPVGIEVVHHPVVTVHIGQLVDHIGQMRGKIGAGARLAQIPHDVARGDDKRGDQSPYPMPDVLLLTFLQLPRRYTLRLLLPSQHLHPRLFIVADYHTTLLLKAQSL